MLRPSRCSPDRIRVRKSKFLSSAVNSAVISPANELRTNEEHQAAAESSLAPRRCWAVRRGREGGERERERERARSVQATSDASSISPPSLAGRSSASASRRHTEARPQRAHVTRGDAARATTRLGSARRVATAAGGAPRNVVESQSDVDAATDVRDGTRLPVKGQALLPRRPRVSSPPPRVGIAPSLPPHPGGALPRPLISRGGISRTRRKKNSSARAHHGCSSRNCFVGRN